MPTKDQIRANRNNARRSTGPRTAEGKARSSQNALKHGLRAQPTVLPGENSEDFDFLVAELVAQFQPETALEWNLLRQLADAEWRMRRVPQLEAAFLVNQLHDSRRHHEKFPDGLPADPEQAELYLAGSMITRDAARRDALSKLSRYEARLTHRYFKALDHLTRFQNRRASTHPPADQGPTETRQTNPIRNHPQTSQAFTDSGGASSQPAASRLRSTQIQTAPARNPAAPDEAFPSDSPWLQPWVWSLYILGSPSGLWPKLFSPVHGACRRSRDLGRSFTAGRQRPSLGSPSARLSALSRTSHGDSHRVSRPAHRCRSESAPRSTQHPPIHRERETW